MKKYQIKHTKRGYYIRESSLKENKQWTAWKKVSELWQTQQEALDWLKANNIACYFEKD